MSLPMLLLTALMLTGGRLPSDALHRAALAVTYAVFNSAFFLMLYTGKTDRWRAPLFISYAALFIISFMSHTLEARGTLLVTNETMLKCGTPFCHIVIPTTLITAVLSRTIIFPGTMLGGYASVGSMFVIWIGASLALGKGWCSWGCFFGGLDDGFSRILRRPFIRGIPQALADLPFAILMLVVLTSSASLAPQYCAWLCPFKAVTEFRPVLTSVDFAKTAVFVSLFLGFVVVLPMLTKRRTQCALLCPFGAMQSAANSVAPCDVRLDTSACVKCGLCIRNCPTLSLTEASLAVGAPSMTCVRCGRCLDSCPKGAWHHHVRGTGPEAGHAAARLLFLYPAFLFFATMAGGSYQDGLVRLGRLVLTGRTF